MLHLSSFFFFFQAEDGIRDVAVTGVQTCALPISHRSQHHSLAHDVGSGALHGVTHHVIHRTGLSPWPELEDLAQVLLLEDPAHHRAPLRAPALVLGILHGHPFRCHVAVEAQADVHEYLAHDSSLTTLDVGLTPIVRRSSSSPHHRTRADGIDKGGRRECSGRQCRGPGVSMSGRGGSYRSSAVGPYNCGIGTSSSRRYTVSWPRWCTKWLTVLRKASLLPDVSSTFSPARTRSISRLLVANSASTSFRNSWPMVIVPFRDERLAAGAAQSNRSWRNDFRL